MQGFPRGPPVLATIQPYGPRAQINYAVIIGVYGECSHIAIHYFLPGSTAILSTIATVERNTCKNNLRPFPAPGQTFDGTAREKLPYGRCRSVAFLHHGQSVVKRNEKAQFFVHKVFLQTTLALSGLRLSLFDAQFFLCLCQNRPIGDLIDRNRFLDLCSPESILKSDFQNLISHGSIRSIGGKKTFEHALRGLSINLCPLGKKI